MKETKVYMSELPESCDECKYYTQFTDGMGCIVAQELRPMDECGNYMQASCPLHSIKDHDRELVKKVLEKAKSLITKYDLLKDYNSCAGYYMLDKIIDQIQKEYEDE